MPLAPENPLVPLYRLVPLAPENPLVPAVPPAPAVPEYPLTPLNPLVPAPALELVQVVPLLVSTLPLVPGATNCTAPVALPRITLLAVRVDKPVPPALGFSTPPVLTPGARLNMLRDMVIACEPLCYPCTTLVHVACVVSHE